ncbi:MAG: YhcH/YjgK/YiaL family protein, partial [Opitutaceae bacterium]|nr:YhcH/YjgK/YiaL family protein [Opitutaceae bacterium]
HGSAAHQRLQGLAAGTANKVELDGGVIAIEQVYLTKERYARYESHRRYIDIQVVLEGEELMEVADIGRLTVKEPFVEERDVIMYGDFGGASVLRFQPGDAAVYRPEDGHMPNLRVGAEGALVRKVVMKVPV